MKQGQLYPQWRGFEIRPQGALLEQVIDLSGAMGLAYERSCEFYKDFHTHSRMMFVFPRGACRMSIRAKDRKSTYTIDHSMLLTVPSHIVHDDEGKSAVYDTLALYPDAPLLDAAIRALAVPSSKAKAFFGTPIHCKRTAWLEQLVEEYFFRRLVAHMRDQSAINFLEQEIVTEVLRCALGAPKKRTIAPRDAETVADRAIRFIETHLFEEIDLQTIAKKSGASLSTLIRAFKRDVGSTPYGYIRNRRMDEAMLLLKRDLPVGQVAILVGYSNFGAFTDAFKTRFGKPPSRI